MNQVTLVLVFVCLNQICTARQVKGYFINLTDDTAHVVFDVPIAPPNDPDVKHLHFGINFTDHNKVQRELKPHQAKEVCFSYNNITTRLLQRQDHLNLEKKMFKKEKSYIFLKLEVDGKLKLFSFYYTQHVSMDFSFQAKFMIFQKEQGLLYMPKNTSFRRSMMRYLEDCDKVKQRLDLKMYGKGDEEEIVKDYNDKCVKRA